MKRWGLVLGSIVVAGSITAACTSKTIAAAGPTPAAGSSASSSPVAIAAAAAKPAPSTITVVGVGTTYAQPDSVDAEFTLNVQRDTASAALSKMKNELASLTQALGNAGVNGSDVAVDTGNFNNSSSPGQINYSFSQSVHAELGRVSGAANIISKIAAAIGTYLQNVNLTYGADQSAALLTGARTTAMADAKARALALAKLAGRSLGQIQSISETVTSTGGQQYGYYGGSGGNPLPSLSYALNVTVVYALH